MFRIAAPFEASQTTTILPNPSFGDQENLEVSLDQHRAMDGTIRTYISRGGRRRVVWTFTLDRKKGIELREFIFSYHSTEILIEDHNGRRWRGILANNPPELRMTARWGNSDDFTKNEKSEITLEFIAELLTPDVRSSIKHERSAASHLELTQQITSDMAMPTDGLVNDWDATKITPQADNTRLTTWADNVSGGNNLVTYSDSLSASDPGINYSPYYQTKVFGAHPGVYFTQELGNFNVVSTAMQTTSDTEIFKNKRGTMFFVFAHNLGGIPGGFSPWSADNEEHTLWDFRTGDETQYEFNVVGGANVFAPVVFNIDGDTTTGTPKLHGAWQPIPRGRTLLYTLQRDSHTSLRFRVNGIEKDGRLIHDHASKIGRLRVGVGEKALHGWMGQVLVYENSLDDADIALVETALSHKWGACLGVDLPVLSDCYPHICRSFPESCSNGIPNFDTSSFNLDCNCKGE